MRKYPTKRLIQETKAIIRLYLFLRHEVGLREGISFKDLKVLLEVLKQAKNRFTAGFRVVQ
jgi:hypothetical protein